MSADAEPLEILLHLPLLCEDKVSDRAATIFIVPNKIVIMVTILLTYMFIWLMSFFFIYLFAGFFVSF